MTGVPPWQRHRVTGQICPASRPPTADGCSRPPSCPAAARRRPRRSRSARSSSASPARSSPPASPARVIPPTTLRRWPWPGPPRPGTRLPARRLRPRRFTAHWSRAAAAPPGRCRVRSLLLPPACAGSCWPGWSRPSSCQAGARPGCESAASWSWKSPGSARRPAPSTRTCFGHDIRRARGWCAAVTGVRLRTGHRRIRPARGSAGRGAELLAATSIAVAALVMGTGHLLSTTTFDLPVWAVLCWLIARILRVGNDRLWLAVGLVAGPRRPFTSRWFWAGAVIAVLLWAPYLAWQAGRGWPELSVARSIANGGSGTSAPRRELLPYQLALVSPYLAAVWGAGLVGLLRGRALRWCRPLGVTYIGLAVMFLVADGKPYYLGGMFPLLLSAGAQPTMEWMRRGRARLPRGLVTAAVVLSLTAIPVHAVCRASRGLASHSRRLAELRRRRDGRLA